MSEPFGAGERALLVDEKGRTYLVRLQTGGAFHFHGGVVEHGSLIGAEEGSVLHSSRGMALVCFRPRLADFVLKMPRGAQVVYPKDLASIVLGADVFPGSRVLEAGTGSGSLCIALCRATGPLGRVVTYEMRAEFQGKARENVEAFFGTLPEWLEMRSGPLEDVAGSGEVFDRVILDMPEPWRVLEAAESVMAPGGILCSFVPTTGQIQSLVLALQRRGYSQVTTTETMVRTWHVTERSVRPDHRMVAHTGFITTARLMHTGAPGT